MVVGREEQTRQDKFASTEGPKATFRTLIKQSKSTVVAPVSYAVKASSVPAELSWLTRHLNIGCVRLTCCVRLQQYPGKQSFLC